VAKVSNVNIAITGNSTGLEKAGERATRTLKRVQTQAASTTTSLGGMRGQANQLAESLTKLGVGGRALQGLGAVAGLGQVGMAAGAMGGAGLAFGGVAAAAISMNALADSYARLRADAQAASDAVRGGAIGEAEFRRLGFTREGGMALAAYSRQMGAAPIGFGRAFSQAQALGGGGRSNLQNVFEYGPGAIGSMIGTLLSGGIPNRQTVAQSIGGNEAMAFGRGTQMFGGLLNNQPLFDQLAKLFSR
jgi:hypothetical protein